METIIGFMFVVVGLILVIVSCRKQDKVMFITGCLFQLANVLLQLTTGEGSLNWINWITGGILIGCIVFVSVSWD